MYLLQGWHSHCNSITVRAEQRLKRKRQDLTASPKR
jgi:hypothetical protein